MKRKAKKKGTAGRLKVKPTPIMPDGKPFRVGPSSIKTDVKMQEITDPYWE